jgi:hypothetical protein
LYKTFFRTGLILLIVGLSSSAYSFIYINNLESQIIVEKWSVTWYTIIDDLGTWGEVMGTALFPARFLYNPISYEEREEEFGFKATSTLNLTQDTSIIFRVGSDDGVMFFVDEDLLIDSWRLRGFAIDEVNLQLSAGAHNLELWWYEWRGNQGASYDVFDLFSIKSGVMRIILSVEIAFIFLGGGAILLGRKRNAILLKNIIEKDFISLVYGFIYVLIVSYILLFIYASA